MSKFKVKFETDVRGEIEFEAHHWIDATRRYHAIMEGFENAGLNVSATMTKENSRHRELEGAA